jgi:hypothetical protein
LRGLWKNERGNPTKAERNAIAKLASVIKAGLDEERMS